ncbi:zinc-binding protein A33-like isoform X1 [Amia ocellicauda]|uniref:zinc-binding protein A33-like isoform X1 n=1 Tax=Amia ocellicauda TaxID=2972642 RepID=UPI003464089D
MKTDNLCENLDLKSASPSSTMKQPEPETSLPRSTEDLTKNLLSFQGPQKSSDGRVSLCKRISLLLACVWILTLISGLAVYFSRGSEDEHTFLRVRGRHSEQENSNTEITELRKQLQNKENEISNLQTNHSSLQQEFTDFLRYVKNLLEISLHTYRSNTELRMELQNKENEISNLQSRYSSLNASCDVNSVLSEYSRKEGVVLKPVWTWICEAAVDVTLDPNTAQPSLILSEDGKQVRLGDKRQALPDNPERFNPVVSVLGKEGFSSGRHYWEVEVGEKPMWTLGVARESINRKGNITVNPKNGYWTVVLRNGSEYMAAAGPSVLLPLSPKPWKVGVFVDYEGGQVSFYNVEARSHIYTFTDTFTEKLYPFFSPSINEGGKNAAPLIISPVHHTD